MDFVVIADANPSTVVLIYSSIVKQAKIKLLIVLGLLLVVCMCQHLHVLPLFLHCMAK